MGRNYRQPFAVGTTNSSEIGINGLSANPVGLDDLFVLKLAVSDGSNVWAKTFNAGNKGIITPRYAHVDSSENIYVYGQFSGSISAGSTTIASTPNAQSFLLKIDSSGNAVWVSQLAGAYFSGNPKVKCVTDGQDTFIIFNAKIIMAATTNDTGSNRSASVLFSGSGVPSKTITVTQTFILGTGESKTFITTLYPNPTSDILNIQTDQKSSKVEIYDLSGKMLTATENNVKKIQVSNLAKELYIIKLQTENGIITSKLIKNQKTNCNNNKPFQQFLKGYVFFSTLTVTSTYSKIFIFSS